jgi:5,10-methylenetetrahydrofolate reductase
VRLMLSDEMYAAIKAKTRRGRKVSRIIREALAFGIDNPELLPGDPPGPHSRCVAVLIPTELLTTLRATPAYHESDRPEIRSFARRCLAAYCFAFYLREVF